MRTSVCVCVCCSEWSSRRARECVTGEWGWESDDVRACVQVSERAPLLAPRLSSHAPLLTVLIFFIFTFVFSRRGAIEMRPSHCAAVRATLGVGAAFRLFLLSFASFFFSLWSLTIRFFDGCVRAHLHSLTPLRSFLFFFFVIVGWFAISFVLAVPQLLYQSLVDVMVSFFIVLFYVCANECFSFCCWTLVWS